MGLESANRTSASSEGILVAAGNGAYSGTYTELIASTSQANKVLFIQPQINATDTRRPFKFKLAIGAAASESDILELFTTVGYVASDTLICPVSVASGQRISADAWSNALNSEVMIGLTMSNDASYGTGAANELVGISGNFGTSIDPGGSANTKGSWTELVASTSHDYDYAIVNFDLLGNAVLGANTRWLVDIGVGGAGAEAVEIPDIPVYASTFEDTSPLSSAYLVAISSGSRVSARAQSDNTDATDRLIGVSVVGFNLTAPTGGGGTVGYGHA